MDFRKQSYSEELGDISVVVDTLGREKEGAQRMLKELKGAGYVSLQPKVLKVNECPQNIVVICSAYCTLNPRDFVTCFFCLCYLSVL